MKIDFDLPEFEKEININIIIRKDGEVVYSASSSTSDVYNTRPDLPPTKPAVEEKPKKTTGKKGGNFMDADF